MKIYDISVKSIRDEDVKLDKYKGKVLLIFNSASRCGYTYQYEAIETLYAKYKDEGFEVLDFPCNQFLHQAPGTSEEQANFCRMKFGTTFTTFGKVNVNGAKTSELYKFLKSQKPYDYPNQKESFMNKLLGKQGKIKWNFTKFLVDKNGHVIERFGPDFEPGDLVKRIEALLEK